MRSFFSINLKNIVYVVCISLLVSCAPSKRDLEGVKLGAGNQVLTKGAAYQPLPDELIPDCSSRIFDAFQDLDSDLREYEGAKGFPERDKEGKLIVYEILTDDDGNRIEVARLTDQELEEHIQSAISNLQLKLIRLFSGDELCPCDEFCNWILTLIERLKSENIKATGDPYFTPPEAEFMGSSSDGIKRDKQSKQYVLDGGLDFVEMILGREVARAFGGNYQAFLDALQNSPCYEKLLQIINELKQFETERRQNATDPLVREKRWEKIQQYP